jgi:hypothetical protein
MDDKILQVRHYGLNICASEALWMKLCESGDVTGYLACHIAGRGIVDEKILGEALSRVKGLYNGIPHYLPNKNRTFMCFLSSLSIPLCDEKGNSPAKTIDNPR